MAQFLLSEAAAADLETIDDYTIEHFGLEQADQTASRLLAAFEELAQVPLAAPRRPDLSPLDRPFRFRPVLNRLVIRLRAIS